MRARDYSPRSTLHADAKILDGLSATLPLPDWGRVVRQPTRTHLANPGLERKRLITTIDFGFARCTEENVSQYAKL